MEIVFSVSIDNGFCSVFSSWDVVFMLYIDFCLGDVYFCMCY